MVDTGKLYHHKMRLDSVLRKPDVCRENILLYIKTRHYLYFINGKVSDQLLYKFIDKILLRKGKISKIDANNYNYTKKSEPVNILTNDF